MENEIGEEKINGQISLENNRVRLKKKVVAPQDTSRSAWPQGRKAGSRRKNIFWRWLLPREDYAPRSGRRGIGM